MSSIATTHGKVPFYETIKLVRKPGSYKNDRLALNFGKIAQARSQKGLK
jgi:hypothetical protein